MLIAAFAFCALALVHGRGLPVRPSPLPLPRTPLAVVLIQDRGASSLAIVDLLRFRVARRIRLRSLCLSIDGDSETRVVATAQCGGPDRAADNACGILDAETGRLNYVDLEVPNPTSVAAVAGRAFVLHGFEQSAGACTSVVDLRRAELLESGHVDPSAQRSEVAAGRALLGFSAIRHGGADRGQVGALVSASSVDTLAVLPFDSLTVVADARTPSAGAVTRWCVTSLAEKGGWRVWRMVAPAEGVSARIMSAPLSGVSKGVYEACRVGGYLALADADGLDLSDPGREVIILDAKTLREVQRFRVTGTPAAMRAWGERLLVFDGITGELLLYEPGYSAPARRLSLGGAPLGSGDLVVFP